MHGLSRRAGEQRSAFAPCRIGINLLWLGPESGGAFQYARDFVRDLLSRDSANEYVVFVEDAATLPVAYDPRRVTIVRVGTASSRSIGVRLRALWHLAWLLVVLPGPHRPRPDGFRARLRARHALLRLWLRSHFYSALGSCPVFSRSRLDLLIQPAHGWGALFSGVCYLAVIHDFPPQWSRELRERLGREHVRYADAMQRAVSSTAEAVFVDSDLGKLQLQEAYGVPTDRVHVLPFRPPSYINPDVSREKVEQVLRKHRIPGRYVFYPAGIQPHKNHLALMTALAALRDHRKVSIPCVLLGHAGSAMEALRARIHELRLDAQVHYLGYVEDDDVSALYRSAAALVMPTLIGPTNIPVVEAFKMGCPVVCSRVPDFEQQIGDAGVLVDPSSTEDLAQAIYRVWTDESLREELIERGRRRVSSVIATDYGERILATVQQALTGLSRRS